MKKTLLVVLATFLLLSATSMHGVAEVARVGATAPNFTLKNAKGEEVSLKIFINGVQEGSQSSVSFSNNTSQPLTVGAITTATGWNENYYVNGYIDEFRITKGIARYTSNFTPPTAAFPLL